MTERYLERMPLTDNSDSVKRAPIDNLIWLLTTVLIAAFIIFDTNVWISYILLGITAAVFVLTGVKRHGRFVFRFESFHGHVLLFAFFCFFSAFWAWNSVYAIVKGTTVLEILICMSLLYIYYQDQPDVGGLINSIKWAGYAVTIYAFLFYGYSTIKNVLSQGERLGTDFANINSMAIFSALAITVAVYQLLYKGLSFSHLLCIPCVVIVVASGSRKALVLAILGCLLVILQRYTTRNVLENIARFALILVIAFFLLRLISTLSIFSGIDERMEGLFALITGKGTVDSSAAKRDSFMRLAFSQFLQSPIIGIGMDNARLVIQQAYGYATYSHNNFAELLCNGGIMGFLIFYSMHFTCIGTFFKYRKMEDPLTAICLPLALVMLVMDWGMVSYYSKSTYFYYLIFFLHAKNLKRKAAAYEPS